MGLTALPCTAGRRPDLKKCREKEGKKAEEQREEIKGRVGKWPHPA